MKKLLYIFLTLVVLAIFVAIFAYINQDKLIDRYIERQSRGANFDFDLLEDTVGIKLITVGTGSPLPSKRAQTCNAVLVNGHFFLFDIGAGAARKLESYRLPITQIEAVFISHWHSDHFIDLPAILNRTWLLGRSIPVDIYGPGEVEEFLGGMQQMMEQEVQNRIIHHGDSLMTKSLAHGIPHPVRIEGQAAVELYSEDGIRITAFLVDHEPVVPSVGYKIEYKGKSIVLGGDTKKSSNLIRHAADADLLVHEALQVDFIQRAAQLQQQRGNVRNAEVLIDMLAYHSSPQEAAEVARDANVKKLVLNHLTPAPENPISRRFYRVGLDKIYNGPILLAEDGDIFFVQ